MEKINQVMESVLNYIDCGNIFRKPFKWLYWVIGVIIALAILDIFVDRFNYFKYYSAGEKAGLVLVMIVMLASAVFSVFYWIRRAKDVEKVVDVNARFVAIPVVAHIIRSLGEFCGICSAIFGNAIFIIGTLFSMKHFDSNGIVGIIVCPIAGYFTLLLSRFMSESIAVVTSIANDTRSLVEKAEEKAEEKAPEE